MAFEGELRLEVYPSRWRIQKAMEEFRSLRRRGESAIRTRFQYIRNKQKSMRINKSFKTQKSRK